MISSSTTESEKDKGIDMFRNSKEKGVPKEFVAAEAIRAFLASWIREDPEGVNTAQKALDGGREPGRAGEVFHEHIQARFEGIHKESGSEIRRMELSRSESEAKVRAKDRELDLLKNQIKQVELEKAQLEKRLNYQENHIRIQNETLAEQHEQLMRLISTTQSE